MHARTHISLSSSLPTKQAAIERMSITNMSRTLHLGLRQIWLEYSKREKEVFL